MSTSKYIVYQCNTCKRETEILLDARRPDPVRCNITLNCRGKLQKTGERASKGFLFTPIVPGLDDYVPRFTDLTVPPVPEVSSPITLFSGKGMMTIALVQREQVENVASFFIYDAQGNQVTIEQEPASFLTHDVAYMNLYVYEVTPAMLKYKKYLFEAPNGIQLLRGLDDSREGKNLRFTSVDTIKVFVNGVEISSTQYDRSVVNQITLTPAVTLPESIVEVYIYDELQQNVAADELIPLKFKPLTTSNSDLEIRDQNSWGDFAGVEIEGRRRLLLFCTDTGELDVNKSYGVQKAEVQSADQSAAPISIRYRDLYFLLGREPFMFQDKELHAYVTGEKLIAPSTILNYRQSTASGEYELVIDSKLIDQVYHPITPVIPITSIQEQSTRSVQTVNGAEDLKRKYILGPS